jgi:histidine ammonia-lyase
LPRMSVTVTQWCELIARLATLLGRSVRVDATRLDRSVQQRTMPVEQFLGAAIALCDGATADLRAPLATLAPSLRWRQNPTYANADFLDGYGYCELLGPAGHLRDESMAIGLLLLAPRVTYPEHAHPATETYVVLGGRAEWRQGERDWRRRAPGERIEHASGEPHAMRTTAEPLLAAYLWHDHLHERAQLTP